MSYTIYFDLYINASKQEVFSAVTSPDHLSNWWPLKCTGGPRLGEIYNFNFTNDYDWYGKVSNVVVDNSFHIKMTISDTDWNGTTFGFELQEKEEGVILLKFFHKDWKEVNHHYRFSAFCWAKLLDGLKEYIEKGIIIPFDQRS